MANTFTTAAYPATTDAVNLSSVNWTATLDGTAQGGFAVIPAATGVFPGVEFFRGGLATSQSSLDDPLCQALEGISNAMVSRDTGNTNRLFIMAPDYPEGDGGRTGGTAGAGTDEFGGVDLESCALCFGSMSEFGKADGDLRAVMGTSRGGMESLMYLRAYKRKPKCVVLWNPFINVVDWNNVAAATQDDIAAMIPGFTSPAPDTFAALSPSEKKSLFTRSPVQWANELPDVPYLVLHGDNDTTAKREWVNALVQNMSGAGLNVEYRLIANGGHVFANEALNAAVNRTVDFLSTHLRRDP